MASSFTHQGSVAPPERAQSPVAPPYSPITPEEPTFPRFPSGPTHPPDFMDTEPDSEPINETTNSDAIALRAALGILQIQRQRALQDMQTLERQKGKALEDPEAFSNAIVKGTIRSRAPQQFASGSGDTEDSTADAMDEDDGGSAEGKEDPSPGFGEIPTAQSVARCPPINWAKYHVVGEALDKLHEEQQNRPGSGHGVSERAPLHHVTAPYNPWKDKLPEKPSRNRTDTTRKPPP